jgi:hypothetical protein
MRLKLTGWMALVLTGCVLVAARPTTGQEQAVVVKGGVDAKTAFKRIKTLVGTWTSEAEPGKEHEDHHKGESNVTYKLTGAGSALVETQFPGQPHEMVSVYHLDGEELRMTHYCAIGNQPRVKLDRANSTPDHLVFVFDGGTNLDAQKDTYIHGLKITFRKDGKVDSAWESYQEGKSAGYMTFTHTRK